jgi:hypothetical protein
MSSRPTCPVAEEVRAVPGVEEAVPILYTEGMIEANGSDYIVYLFGVPPALLAGRPVWAERT